MSNPPPPPVPPTSSPPPAPAAPVAPPQKPPFAYQAAQFALWGPFVALGLGCLSAAGLNQATYTSSDAQMRAMAGMVIGIVNLAILLTSLIMGIIALTSIPRLGTRRLLFRSLIGMTFTLLMLVLIGLSFWALISIPKRTAARLTGEWNLLSTPGSASRIHMSLRSDGTGSVEILGGPTPISASGHWRLSGGNPPRNLELKFDAPLVAGRTIEGLGWQISTIDGNRLELLTKDADGNAIREIYTRAR